MKILLDCEICSKEFRVVSVPTRRGGERPIDRSFDICNPSGECDLGWESVCFDCERDIVLAIKSAVDKLKNGKHA